MNAKELKQYVIIPVIDYLKLNSGYNLTLGTGAQETHLGEYLVQQGGPALGLFQTEPVTHTDIRQRYLLLPENSDLNKLVLSMLSSKDIYSNGEKALITNLEYATAICRIRYLMSPEKLPAEDNIPAMAEYWKAHYNTPQGRGKVSEFIINYHHYVDGKVLW